MAKAQLSVLFESISGSAGSVALLQTRYGPALRARQAPPDPKTEVQIARRAAMTKAGEIWRTLADDQVQAWRDYAAERGSKAAPNALFTGLARKILQIDPEAQIPLWPPTAPFNPDQLELQAEIEGDEIVISLVESDSLRTIANEKSKIKNGKSSIVNSKSADSPALTEILLQPLPSRQRLPIYERYRSKAFHRFTPESPTLRIPIPIPAPPAIALAVRMTSSATGQETSLQPLAKLVTS